MYSLVSLFVLFIACSLFIFTRKYVEKKVDGLSEKWDLAELKSLNYFYYKIFYYVTIICLSMVLVMMFFSILNIINI